MSIRQIIRLIPVAQKKQGLWITFSTVLQALLNMAGLTVLIPVIVLIFDPDRLAEYPVFASHRNLIMISIVCFIIAKNLLNIRINNTRVRYINKLYHYYSGKLYDNYYKQGLLFIKEKHSDELAYNTNAVCYLFAHGTLSLMFSMISEFLLLVFIWCGIFWFSPIIALCIAVCLLPFAIIYFYWFKKKLMKYGKEENDAKRSIMTLVGDTFRGYPDIKLNDAYFWFKKRFDANIVQISRCREWITRTLQIPHGMMELYVIVGMILFAVIGGDNNETRFTFGVLAVAVLRMIPSMQSLLSMATQWKNNTFTLDIIEKIKDNSQEKEDLKTIRFQEQIKLDGISFRYSGKESFILNNFSLNIKKGECIGIQGVSGVGKTTLFNLLLGFYEPQEGEIRIDDQLLDRQTLSSWQKLIAYVPQDIFIMDATLAENIAFGADEIDNKRVISAMEQSGLSDLVSSLADGIHTRIGQDGGLLSGGERQRVGIARSLYKKAEIIFFDETTSYLDPKTEKEVLGAIRKLSTEIKGLTVVIVSHKQSTLAFCDRIVDMN